MQDLFTTGHTTDNDVPLAERMRPRTIDEVVGQSHLLGPGKPLRVAFESARPHSMILWGPPGVGKTTLARLMADAFALDFIAISAVLGGVKDIRDAVERATATRARAGRPTVVFVDEVHRFNKAQQDAFLPHVESGLFIFVGATTENPSFEVVGALLSRAAVYVLEPLTAEELESLMVRAADGPLGGLAIERVARRIVRMAVEDIGLADPRGLEIALAASETYERLGSPEGELAIAQAIVYLAIAPKSNALYEAYNAARALVQSDASRPVPMHLRNAPTRLMKDLGYGAGYRYAHDEPGAYAAGEHYFPDGLAPQRFYQPKDQGVEARIRERLAQLRARDADSDERKP